MPLTILVADDDLGTRLSVSDYLEMLGYSVIAAENGQQALALVEQYQPHLIVTDIAMPEMDGYEFVRRVRVRPEFRLLPVIFLTARTSTQERIRGYQLGCDNYLPKPFELEELGAVIRSLLERYAHFAQTASVPSLSSVEASDRYSLSDGTGATEFLVGSSTTRTSVADSFNFTPREQEVLNLLTDGLSNARIGDSLHLSPRTIEKYVSNLLRKTDTNNRSELVRFAIEHRLVD
ncbi:MAG: response regulator transcription factor [Okeania sp. SIO2H7]|nr:response regulator transcription factor [Okeania sp. SIO2H7]